MPADATLTYSLLQAWEGLFELTPLDLRTRPRAALAERLGVSSAIMGRHLTGLSRAGLVRLDGRRVTPVLPDGILLHVHSPFEECDALVEAGDAADASSKLNQFRHSKMVYRNAATPGNHYEMSRRKDPCIYLPKGENRPDRTDLIRRVRGVIEGRHVGRGRPESKSDPALVKSYTARRRDTDPLYEPTVKDRNNLAVVARKLEQRHVPRDRWDDFLRDAFRMFKEITRGRCEYPPTNVLAGGSLIEQYVAAMPRRRFNTDRAAAMLAEAGFSQPIKIVLSLVRRLRRGHDLPEDLNDDLTAAVEYLNAHLHEVGYVEDDA